MAAAPAHHAASERCCYMPIAAPRELSVVRRDTQAIYHAHVFGRAYTVRCVLAFLLIAGFISPLAGCRTSAELLEAELRRKERENEQLTQKLRDCECEVRLLEADYERLLREIRSLGKAEIRGLAYLKEITLGRLTGGLDEDPECPGDDALLVVVEPRDLDDQVVKVPGHVQVDVFEVNRQGLKHPLSSWSIPARELRTKWETPLIGSPSYRLVLPWQVMPHYERLRVVVRFTTLDGRTFETDRDVTIRLPRRDPERCRISEPLAHEPITDSPCLPSLGRPIRRSTPAPAPDAILLPPATPLVLPGPSPGPVR